MMSRQMVAFNLVKGCKSKEYAGGSTFLAWQRLKNKFELQCKAMLLKWKNCSVNVL
jgi:hypothetical protein